MAEGDLTEPSHPSISFIQKVEPHKPAPHDRICPATTQTFRNAAINGGWGLLGRLPLAGHMCYSASTGAVSAVTITERTCWGMGVARRDARSM